MGRRLKTIKISVSDLENSYVDESMTAKDLLKKSNAKECYMADYIQDTIYEHFNENVTLFDIWDGLLKKENIYDIIGVSDSITRERFFQIIANKLGVCYHMIYSLWLNQ